MITAWDKRFLSLAELVASWSKDPGTRCGAVIALADHRVAALGFNGFPQGMPDAADLLADRDEKLPRTVHAEMNALVLSGRSFRTPECAGATLYTWPMPPCDRCCVHVLQAGIRRIVAPAAVGDVAERWAPQIARTRRYCRELGAEFVEVGEEGTQA